MLDPKIKNDVHRWAQHLTDLGHGKGFVSTLIAILVKNRGPVGTGKYACTCNNWGPRWIEDSQHGCCPGCWAGALDADQSMFVNGVKPVTMAMIDQSQSWGFDRAKLRALRANRLSNELFDRYHNFATHWESDPRD
jgi:hypothetical protein